MLQHQADNSIPVKGGPQLLRFRGGLLPSIRSCKSELTGGAGLKALRLEAFITGLHIMKIHGDVSLVCEQTEVSVTQLQTASTYVPGRSGR
jgi:hypothetical protein